RGGCFLLFLFFFQAEDGIRDLYVTGVQTCALPIYSLAGVLDGTSGSDVKNSGQGVDDLLAVIMRIDVDHPEPGRNYSIPKDNPRSEERRVGKECRSRWALEQ